MLRLARLVADTHRLRRLQGHGFLAVIILEYVMSFVGNLPLKGPECALFALVRPRTAMWVPCPPAAYLCNMCDVYTYLLTCMKSVP